MKAIILAAGVGSRIGESFPKAMIRLVTGKTILAHQVESLTCFMAPKDITVVVGFRGSMIVNAFPNLNFVENADYRTTNTAKSLLLALERVGDDTVLFSEGDVVCDNRVFDRIVACESSCMAAHDVPLGDEEMKYTTRRDGTIDRLSKGLSNGEGEVLGVNKILEHEREALMAHLRRCGDDNFFERAIEMCIDDGIRFQPVDVSDLYGIEVDFPEDLALANRMVREAGLCDLLPRRLASVGDVEPNLGR